MQTQTIRADEFQAFNGVMKLVQMVLWIPLRVLLYYVFYSQYKLLMAIWKEPFEGMDPPVYRDIFVIICFYFLGHSFVLYHIMIYKPNPGHVHVSKFQPSDKRFSKEQLKSMSTDLNKLLSYSHKNEDDLATYLESSEREQIKRCNKCDARKTSSMSHCVI